MKDDQQQQQIYVLRGTTLLCNGKGSNRIRKELKSGPHCETEFFESKTMKKVKLLLIASSWRK